MINVDVHIHLGCQYEEYLRTLFGTIYLIHIAVEILSEPHLFLDLNFQITCIILPSHLLNEKFCVVVRFAVMVDFIIGTLWPCEENFLCFYVKPFVIFCLSGLLYFSNSLPRATTSEETSSGANQYKGKDHEGVVTLEDAERKDYNDRLTTEASREESTVDGQTQTFELLDNLSVSKRVKIFRIFFICYYDGKLVGVIYKSFCYVGIMCACKNPVFVFVLVHFRLVFFDCLVHFNV